MRKDIPVNTMRYQNACMDQKVAMKMDSAGMVTPVGAYTSRQEGAKREINAIFTTEEREPTTVSKQISFITLR